jgi:hypothetical protein
MQKSTAQPLTRSSPPLGPVQGTDITIFEDTFHYLPLNSQRNQIRLLKILPSPKSGGLDSGIECSLIHASLEESPDYDALSYAWGERKDLRQIFLDGLPFCVTSNLYSALLRLQTLPETKPIWIDAICINQKDLKERSEQVVKMGKIFKLAAEVIAWLGEGDDESELAFTLLRDLKRCLQKRSRLQTILQDPIYLHHFYGLYKLFYRNYWWRVWVIQEVSLARSITILCGRDTFPWSDLVLIQETLATHHLKEIDAIAHQRQELDFLRVSIESRGPRAMLLSEDNQHGERPDLAQTVLKHRFKEASDPRDMVYSLVGLSTAQHDDRFVLDYSKPVCQVFIDVVEYILNTTKKLDIICAMPREQNSHNLPSWVPDWSFSGFGSSLLEHSTKHQFSAAGSSEAVSELLKDRSILKAEGIQIGLLHTIGDPCEMDDLEDDKNALVAFQKWQTLSSSATKDALILAEAFCINALRENYQAKDIEAWQKKSDFLQWILGTFTRAYKSTRPDLKLDDHLDAFSDYRASWRSRKEDDVLGMILIKGMAEMMFARRVFIAGDNIIGLGPDTIGQGDIAAVLLGCQLPVVLRPEGDQFTYLGEAFVNEYMYGKAIDELARGTLRQQEFRIF